MAPNVTAAIMIREAMCLSTLAVDAIIRITLNSPAVSGVTMLMAMTFSPEGSLPVNVPELPLFRAS